MSPETAAWLATLRAEAAAPGSLMIPISGTVRGKPARAIVFPEEFVGKTDAELLAHLRARLAEQ